MSDRRIPFTPDDEDRIASASLWGIIAAISGILGAAVNVAVAVLNHLPLQHHIQRGITLLIALMLGIWLIQACGAFRAVARTDVADKAYLLRGFDKLHAYFLTIGVLLTLALVAFVLTIVTILVLGPGRFMRLWM